MADSENSAADADSNPYWAAAAERLREAGIGVKSQDIPTPSYPYQNVPMYSNVYSPYAPAPMPTVQTTDYNWYSAPPVAAPPPPPSSVMPRPYRLPTQTAPLTRAATGANAVPFQYDTRPLARPTFNRGRGGMLPRGGPNGTRFCAGTMLDHESSVLLGMHRFSSSVPQAPVQIPVDDTLGDPKSGFFIRGRHPPTLKIYVQRALAHPTNPNDKEKCENYLYSKIHPLILSGAVFHVNWMTEPLPHEKNYELTTSWTPASQLKPNTGGNRKDRRRNLSPRGRAGPDIELASPKRNRDAAGRVPSLSGPIIQRGSNLSNGAFPPLPSSSVNSTTSGSSKRSKKRKNKQNSFEGASMFDKRPRGDTPIKAKSYSRHSVNWLGDWIAEHRSHDRSFWSVEVESLKERPYRRRAIIPGFDGSRLARSFPKVLRNLDQVQVDEFFNRNADRFNPNDYDEVTGTCYEVEKKFFRLTKKPEASEIRPLSVLKKAFQRLSQIAKDPSRYKYVCDQLRSIRQDLVVQKIRDEFTVSVYEFHARITLENKDLCEFNQCQSQLRHLYDDIPGCKNENEFSAYRLLYYILTEDDQDILSLLNSLSPRARQSQCLSLAIKVHDALLKGQHIRLFKLYKNTPRMCGNVMELFMERERRRFLKTVRVSYRPVIKVSVLSNWFNFGKQEEFTTFMRSQGIEVDSKPDATTEPPKWPVKQ